MTLDRFLRERQEDHSVLTRLVDEAGRKPERLGPQGVRRLGELYRAAAADLALGRRRWPRDPAVKRLEQLVGRARHLVYDTGVRRESLGEFVTTGYWRRVVERPALLGVSAVLMFGPAVLAAVWALVDPAAAAGLVPVEYQSVADPRPRGADLGLPVSVQTLLSSQIMTNNIQVTFLAFAGGIAAGLGTALILVFNGTLIGVLTGLAFGAGNGAVFTELVVAHGVLELSCIVVAAGAGLRLGWALVDPGRRSRSTALVEDGRRAVEVLLGTVPWLVVAALVEGYLTPAGTGIVVTTTVGVALGGAFWGLVVWRGVVAEPAAPGPPASPPRGRVLW